MITISGGQLVACVVDDCLTIVECKVNVQKFNRKRLKQ